jgi:hypothetical protein
MAGFSLTRGARYVTPTVMQRLLPVLCLAFVSLVLVLSSGCKGDDSSAEIPSECTTWVERTCELCGTDTKDCATAKSMLETCQKKGSCRVDICTDGLKRIESMPASDAKSLLCAPTK